MISPSESSGWTPAKYEISGFYFAENDAAFKKVMNGMKYTVTKKEPVNLCGVDGFWYTFKAEECD